MEETSKIVIFTIRDQHSDRPAQIHQEAANVQVPEFSIAAFVATLITVAKDFITQNSGMLSMSFFLGALTFRCIREVKFRTQKMSVSRRSCDVP